MNNTKRTLKRVLQKGLKDILNDINNLEIKDTNKEPSNLRIYQSTLKLIGIESFAKRIYSKTQIQKGSSYIFRKIINDLSNWKYTDKVSILLLSQDKQLTKYKRFAKSISKLIDPQFHTNDNIIRDTDRQSYDQVLASYSASGPISKMVKKYKYSNILYAIRSSLVHELSTIPKKRNSRKDRDIDLSDPLRTGKDTSPYYMNKSKILKDERGLYVSSGDYNLFFPHEEIDGILRSILDSYTDLLEGISK